MDLEREKQIAAEAAVEFVKDGMRVGLGTGTTVAHLLPILAARRLSIECIATSPRTETAAKALGIEIRRFDTFDYLDLTIDGADQIAPDSWLIKGGGGAHTREKIVAISSERFVVIADSSKLVDALHAPVPLELLSFGLAATLNRLTPTTIRAGQHGPDGGVIADYQGEITDPGALAQRLADTPGVIGHGLFAPELVTDILVGRGNTVTRSTKGGLT